MKVNYVFLVAAIITLMACPGADPGGDDHVNQRPSVEILTYSDTILPDQNYSITTDSFDLESDPLSFSWSVNGTAVPGETESSYDFSSHDTGTFVISVTVSDGNLTDSDEVTVYVEHGYLISETAAFDGSTDGIESNTIEAVAVDGDTICLGVYSSGISYSTDAGNTWTALSTADGLAFNSVEDIVIDGDYLYIACFQNISVYNTVSELFLPQISINANALAQDAVRIYAATSSGLQVAAKSDLTSWTLYDSSTGGFGSDDDIRSICISGPSVYLGADHSVIITDSSFGSFQSVDLSAYYSSLSVDHIWANGSDMVLYYNTDELHSTDSINNWASWSTAGISVGGANTALSYDSNNLYLCKYGGPLMISEDFGATWTAAEFPDSVQTVIFGPGSNDIVISGPTIYMAHNYGFFIGTITKL